MGILDIQSTPCARNSILHGAGGSIVAGLVHFLATSKLQFTSMLEPSALDLNHGYSAL